MRWPRRYPSAPVSYTHLDVYKRQHPGCLTLTNWQAGFISKPIPAESVLHVYKKDRPGQVRGVTWLAPVILKLRDLDEYEDAELVRKKIEACFAAFVISPDGSMMRCV